MFLGLFVFGYSLVGQRGGCIIVDATRKGKRFPDSMSKTIPIWICVLNRSISNYLNKSRCDGGSFVERVSIANDLYLKFLNVVEFPSFSILFLLIEFPCSRVY